MWALHFNDTGGEDKNLALAPSFSVSCLCHGPSAAAAPVCYSACSYHCIIISIDVGRDFRQLKTNVLDVLFQYLGIYTGTNPLSYVTINVFESQKKMWRACRRYRCCCFPFYIYLPTWWCFKNQRSLKHHVFIATYSASHRHHIIIRKGPDNVHKSVSSVSCI